MKNVFARELKNCAKRKRVKLKVGWIRFSKFFLLTNHLHHPRRLQSARLFPSFLKHIMPLNQYAIFMNRPKNLKKEAKEDPNLNVQNNLSTRIGPICCIAVNCLLVLHQHGATNLLWLMFFNCLCIFKFSRLIELLLISSSLVFPSFIFIICFAKFFP